MKFFQLILVLVMAAVVSYATAQFSSDTAQEVTAKEESVYERVMRTGKLRCGYLLSPPVFDQNLESGKFSGVIFDYVEALGDRLGLEVVWQEELSLSTYIEDLHTGKYDIECSGGWPNALRGKRLNYTNPFFYAPLVAWVRQDDTRFETDLSALNDSIAKIAVIDGGTVDYVRQEKFPLSAPLSLPASSPLADLLLQVETGKADATFVDVMSGLDYMQYNPGKLKPVLHTPLRLLSFNLSFPQHEYALKEMLDVATTELLNDGVIEGILAKHETVPGMFLRIAKPYEAAQ